MKKCFYGTNYFKSLSQGESTPCRKFLKGVRQMVKALALEEFTMYRYRNIIYFNCNKNKKFRRLLKITIDIYHILQKPMLVVGQKIVPAKFFTIFDDVQECPRALNPKKCVCENTPQYHSVCAGSLMGIVLTRFFSAGRGNFLQSNPIRSEKFLFANGDDDLPVLGIGWDNLKLISEASFNPTRRKLKMHYVTRGVHEAILIE